MSNVVQFPAKAKAVRTVGAKSAALPETRAEKARQVLNDLFLPRCLQEAALIAGILHHDYAAVELLHAELLRRMRLHQYCLEPVPPDLAYRCADYLHHDNAAFEALLDAIYDRAQYA